MMETHKERIERTRAAYREAQARLVKRLRDAPVEAVERVPADGGWSAAQIGWHVAATDAWFAGAVSGDAPGAKPLPDGVEAKPWSEMADAMPSKFEAGKAICPQGEVRRDDALKRLSEASARLDAALAGLPEERGLRYAITHPVVGTVTLSQVGDWATAHTIRHDAQAKRVLGS
jgi:uncharacterized damage-inducible protein DinB